MNLERTVVLRAAAFALLLATPAAMANTYLQGVDPKPSGAIVVSFFVVILGFAVGGFTAGREATHDAARHGAAAALAAWVLVELIAVLSPNGHVNAFSIVFLGFLAASLGTIGAMIGARPNAGRPS